MPKRIHKKKPKSKEFVALKKVATLLFLALFFSAIIVSIAFVSYNLGMEEASKETPPVVTVPLESVDTLHERLQKTLEDAKKEIEETHNTTSALVEKSKEPITVKITPPIEVVIPPKLITKPKLAIILDDVSFEHEVKEVKKLNIKVNFSFFPPTPAHPMTAELAKKEPFYLVHLPLEAKNFHQEEPNTLRVDDSVSVMVERLKAIKEDFPRLHFLNNHTGSTFTSNEKSVRRLLKATRKLKLEMIDSRTTAMTMMPKVYKKYNARLLSRNIFLDHESGVEYICGQIDQAVSYALKHGQAIAIGHPRASTIKALKKCKDKFNAVELIYINQI